MSSIGHEHRELVNGVGKCSKPMWDGYGMPNGFCDQPAYGPYVEGEWYRNAYSGERVRFDGKFCGYVPALACPRHGGPDAPVTALKDVAP